MLHVDALKKELGTRLFICNDKGYIATDAGLQILRVGGITEQQFDYMASQIGVAEDNEMQGLLTVTSLDEIITYLLPVIATYRQRYPDMKVNFMGDIKNYNLEYGEADVAIRVGPKPTTPDNIVISLGSMKIVYAVANSYVQSHGKPENEESMAQHQFITMINPPELMLWSKWLRDRLPESCFNLSVASGQALQDAIIAGHGIGPMALLEVDRRDNMVQVYTPKTWTVDLWCLVHRDMYSLPKVKRFVEILRASMNKLLA